MTLPPLPTADAPGDRHQPEQIKQLLGRREWRLQRRSPPRCLQCGSTEISYLELHKPLPIEGGSVVLDVVGFCDPKHDGGCFSSEGERLPT